MTEPLDLEPTLLERTPVDVAWAAGVFEGEGCITISGVTGPRPQARLKMNMTDEDVVRRFHLIVGIGTVREDRRFEKRGWKRQWEWYIGSRAGVLTVLDLFGPHLGARRSARAEQIRAYIERGELPEAA